MMPFHAKQSCQSLCVSRNMNLMLSMDKLLTFLQNVLLNTQSQNSLQMYLSERKRMGHILIQNFSDLNQFIEYHHFKMDTTETVIGLMRLNCFMASLDLSNAYFSVPIVKTNQCFLIFQWNDELYQFTVLVFSQRFLSLYLHI